MKPRIKILYLSIALLLAALIVTLQSHALIKKESIQSESESKLPFGNYLPNAENPLIRVVIKTGGFQGVAHNEVQLKVAGGAVLCAGENKKEVADGEVICIKPDDPMFQAGNIFVEPKTKGANISIPSIVRGCGTPSYRGKLELYTTAEGIVIVNEVALEEYLYAVVPSEMPASYEMEALKCQAICARSYAYCQMLAFAYPEYLAHVDDSVSFQVYGNSGEKEATTRAVQETMGQKLWYKGNIVKTYYYSTSCGHSTDIGAWGTTITEENDYLKGVPVCDEEGNAYEKELPWYRWKATISSEVACGLIERNTGVELGNLQNISITKQGIGGVAMRLEATGSKGTAVVETENRIRSALGGEGYTIEKQDGTVVKSAKLLPSAFFLIAKNGENYIIEGGGYGHGIGMSQNGANEMAKSGKTYEEILPFFYSGTKVE